MSVEHRAIDRTALVRSATIGLLGLTGLYLIDPNTTHVPLCPLHAATGLWCPLCGATRASHALLHADLATALRDNALFVLCLPLLALAWSRWLRGSADRRLVPRPAMLAVLALGLAFGVLRNLPGYSWLAPPG